ncbi:type VI secretion system baseplate subunit TssF [Pendulispora rubella]|uniref:Type VI secretion system baseplate subunit TssF n=1 Tax=Pendulispora rubella TaxID=2741070 RepID=A0ABZ2KU30_9BACT
MHSYPDGVDAWCARHAERLASYEPRLRHVDISVVPRGRLLSIRLEAMLVSGMQSASFSYETDIDPHHHRSGRPKRTREFPTTDFRNLLLAAEHLGTTLPDFAGALGGTAPDPTTEHVADAALFLGAITTEQIRNREQTDGYRGLAECVDRSLLRPLPAATIVQLEIDEGAETLAANSEAAATSTRWRLVGETDVGAYRFERACIIAREDQGSALQFSLRATGSAPLSKVIGGRPVRVYFDGEAGNALLWLSFVLEHGRRASLVPVSAGGDVAEGHPLGSIAQWGLRPEQLLAADPDAPNAGIDLLLDYFRLKEKFFFCEIGFDADAWLATPDAREARIVIDFDAPAPPGPPPKLSANCAVMVNLFDAQAEPAIFPPAASFPIRVAGEDTATVYEVTAVTATLVEESPTGAPTAPRPIAVPPIRRSRATAVDPAFPYGYSSVPGPNLEGSDLEVSVALVAPRGDSDPHKPGRHVISVDLWACNGATASALQPGEAMSPSVGISPGIRIRNLLPPTPYVPAPSGSVFRRHALVASQLPTGDAHGTLKQRLASLARRSSSDGARIRANLAQVRAIEQLVVEPSVDTTRGALGYDVVMRFNDAAFAGLEEVWLFLRAVHAGLEQHAGFGRFYRCIALCRSGARLTWPPKVP